jgi:flagellar biosynthetic protein FliR
MFVLSIIKEIAIGSLLAMLLGLILVPARIAGSYIGQEIGISMEPVTNTGNDQSTIITAMFETFTILMFFVLNLHHFLILFLHYSLNELSDRIHLFSLPTEGLVNLVSRVTEHGLSIAAPIGVLSFVTMVGLFLLSKAAPSLNLFSIGMPLRVGLGILTLAMFIPILWRSIEGYFSTMLFEIETFFRYFATS